MLRLDSIARNLSAEPHIGQSAVLRSTRPVVAAIAGTGGGKTTAGIVWLLLHMSRRPGELWLVIEPTWPMIDRVLLRPSVDRPGLLIALKTLDPGAHYVKSDHAIILQPGHRLPRLRHPPRIYGGGHVAGAWLDEAGQMSRLAFETAQRRASYKRGQVLITTTPYNRGWLLTDVYQRWKDGDPDYFVSQFSSLANPGYPREVLERNRRAMSPARFRMMREGGFECPEGMIYDRWDDSMIVPPFPIPDHWPRSAAIDFGFNHPTAAVWLARDPDSVYYLYQEYRKAGDLLANHARAINAISGQAATIRSW